ncbi:hypothetical protein QAD02_020947 [Eretmocerus hayati]|uniref:Uncharacterized protein n=1 Tax=Eretmocerus hayati TaxID=131215 RepID=A0ACC2PPC7_9HYME|nr:hypothetical protein QAD02_020947 [Eretmocerus hayati]
MNLNHDQDGNEPSAIPSVDKGDCQEFKIDLLKKHLDLSIQADKTTFRSKVAYNLAKEAVQVAHKNEGKIHHRTQDPNKLFDRMRYVEYRMRGLERQNKRLQEQLKDANRVRTKHFQPF